MQIIKVISGGQTGADRAGLDAAIHYNIPHGGCCPLGRRAEDGTIPIQYQLIECVKRNYSVRTEINVIDSDATIVFTYGKPKTGSKQTIDFCIEHNKPWLHIDTKSLNFCEAADDIANWLNLFDNDIVLNIAGSRESTKPGMYRFVFDTMVELLSDYSTI